MVNVYGKVQHPAVQPLLEVAKKMHFNVYWTDSVRSWAVQPRTIMTTWLNIASISFIVRGCLFGQRDLSKKLLVAYCGKFGYFPKR